METAIINSYNVPAEKELAPSLFDEFVRWIDRSAKTSTTYIINLRQFVAWMRYAGIVRPQRADVISYRQWLEAEHEAIQLDDTAPDGWTYRANGAGAPVMVKCKPNTVQQYLRSVKQFFAWTAANGYYPNIALNIHAPKVDHDTHRKDSLTAAEVMSIETDITGRASEREAEAALSAKDKAGKIQRSGEQGKRLLAIYLLAVTAGLRTIEISRANVKDLEIKGGEAWLYIWGKGHSEPDQKKAIAPEVAAAIKEYLAVRTDRPTGNSPLFVSTGNRSGGQRIAETTISKMIKEAMREAGFDSERLTAHSLRHTAGTAVMEITGDIYATQQYMRHRDPKTTEIYLHNDMEKSDRQTAEKLYQYYHGGAAR